jgi:GT2 family glycosyltransferase
LTETWFRFNELMVDLSVIIVSYNTQELTCAAVSSVFSSTDSFCKEIIVVDNGSTDGTVAMLRHQYPQVQVIAAGKNLGFARANNLGARQATGEFYLLLNSDARLQPETLTTAVNYGRAHPECGVLGAQLLNEDGSWQNSIAAFPSLATELLNKSLLRRLLPKKYPGKETPFSVPTPVDSVIGAFMLVSRKVWQRLEGLDERFFFFFEETDFCSRVQQCGLKVIFHPECRVWHRQGGSAREVNVRARIEYWRSRYAYFQKHYGLFPNQLLRAELELRLCLNHLFYTVVALFGSTKAQQKKKVNTALWQWHRAGCPAEMGLEPVSK